MEMNPIEYELGKTESKRDIAQGQAQLYWGTRGAWGEYLTKLMAERFMVTVIHAGDIVTTQQTSYQNGYNAETAEYIDQVFGEGAYQRTLDEVWRYRTELYTRYFDSINDSSDKI